MPLDKFENVCFCHEALFVGTGQRAVIHCDWKDKGSPGGKLWQLTTRIMTEPSA